MPTRADALTLLHEYVASPSLRKHCYSVEAAMRAYAEKLGGDPEVWGITGLLHDFDYEKFPVPDPQMKTGHPFHGSKILIEKGYPEEIVRGILSHASYSGVERKTPMEKALFACDEISGFVVAIGHMRPDHLDAITPEVVRKYLNKKKFAEKVSREDIAQGIKELGVSEDDHYETVIKALQGIKGELGF